MSLSKNFWRRSIDPPTYDDLPSGHEHISRIYPGSLMGSPCSGKFLLGDQDVMVVTSVVCQGEILALAEKREWGGKKRIELASLLAKVPTVDINKQAILNAYAMIDAWTHGKSVTAPQNASPPKPAVSMGKTTSGSRPWPMPARRCCWQPTKISIIWTTYG